MAQLKILSATISFLALAIVFAGCAGPAPALPTPTPTPTPTAIPLPVPSLLPALTPTPTSPPLRDTTPPSPVTGLVATDAYDGKVNLSWHRSTAEDFDHYNVYAGETQMVDITGMKPIHQVKDIATSRYQVTGLKDGTKYYFAITAVDKSGNEGVRAASVSATPTPTPRGTIDPDITMDIYQSERAWPGTTLLADNHNPQKPRIIEVNMLGEIIWQYVVPENLKQYTNPGFDMELLANNNILFVLPRNGVYEINRNGNVVWSYLTNKISHDADRLPNGNTIFVFGAFDQKGDAQVTEINPKGETVWAWYAKDHFDKPPYKDIYNEGWTHTNAVSRLSNGNTLISPRNFNFMVEVDPKGSVVRTIGEGIFYEQHDPEALPNGNILATSLPRGKPHQAVEIDPKTGRIVWQSQGFGREVVPVRDANRLPNGNTLITGSTAIVEVTPEGKIVWRLKLKEVLAIEEAARRGFYKAERIGTQR